MRLLKLFSLQQEQECSIRAAAAEYLKKAGLINTLKICKTKKIWLNIFLFLNLNGVLTFLWNGKKLTSSLPSKSVAGSFTIWHINFLVRLAVSVVNDGLYGCYVTGLLLLHTFQKRQTLSFFHLSTFHQKNKETVTLTDFTTPICCSLGCVLRKKTTSINFIFLFLFHTHCQ